MQDGQTKSYTETELVLSEANDDMSKIQEGDRVKVVRKDRPSTWCSSMVFEREAREFNRITLSCLITSPKYYCIHVHLSTTNIICISDQYR